MPLGWRLASAVRSGLVAAAIVDVDLKERLRTKTERDSRGGNFAR